MNLLKTLVLLSSTIFFTACTSSPDYGNGQKFTFDDKELEMKTIYFCQDKPNLEAINIRAKKANAYFTKANKANAEMLIQDMMEKKPRDTSAVNFQKRSENLALDLYKKFSCTLVDTIDY